MYNYYQEHVEVYSPTLRAFLIRKHDGAMLKLFECCHDYGYEEIRDVTLPNPNQGGPDCHPAYAEMLGEDYGCAYEDRSLRTRPLGLPRMIWDNRVFLLGRTEYAEQQLLQQQYDGVLFEEEVAYGLTGIRIALQEPAAQAAHYNQHGFAERPGPGCVSTLLQQYESMSADPFLAPGL